MTDSTAPEGAFFGPFHLIRKIGEGAMGEVFLTRDPTTQQSIALKRPWKDLETDPKSIKRFQREAETTKSINHPSVCRCLEFGQVEDRHYMTMEFVEGMDLAKWVQTQPELTAVRALSLAKKVALGLNAMHDLGVIHRDLKPANIMITPEEDPVITDFGMVNLLDPEPGMSTLTPAGMFVGTPAYMSPEQVLAERERFCPSTDLYGLGVILYELLTGWPPFSGSMATILGTIVSEPPPDLQIHDPKLSDELNAICQKALEKDPSDRFQSGAEFSEAIDRYVESLSGEMPIPEVTNTENPQASESSGLMGRLRSLFKS